MRPDVITLENVEQMLRWSNLVAKRCRKTGRVVTLDMIKDPATGRRRHRVADPGERVPLQNQYLVPDRRVFPISAQSRDALWRSARDRAGLSGFTFHDCRHVAATRIGATVGQPGRLSFPEFCAMFGWRDPRNAMIYVNPRAGDLADKL